MKVIIVILLTVIGFLGCKKQEPPGEQAAVPAERATPPAGDARIEPSPAPVPQERATASPQRALVPPDSVLKVRTTDRLSTESHQTGDTFTATLEEPLVGQRRVIAPRGATVEGRVVEADKGGRVQGVARLAVELTRVDPPDGPAFDVATNTVTKQAPATKAKDAKKVAVGSGVGAIVGAVAGGGQGAAIGAAAGAGAGTAAVLATRGDPAVIESESVLTFTTKPFPTQARKRPVG